MIINVGSLYVKRAKDTPIRYTHAFFACKTSPFRSKFRFNLFTKISMEETRLSAACSHTPLKRKFHICFVQEHRRKGGVAANQSLPGKARAISISSTTVRTNQVLAKPVCSLLKPVSMKIMKCSVSRIGSS